MPALCCCCSTPSKLDCLCLSLLMLRHTSAAAAMNEETVLLTPASVCAAADGAAACVHMRASARGPAAFSCPASTASPCAKGALKSQPAKAATVPRARMLLLRLTFLGSSVTRSLWNCCKSFREYQTSALASADSSLAVGMRITLTLGKKDTEERRATGGLGEAVKRLRSCVRNVSDTERRSLTGVSVSCCVTPADVLDD